MAVAILDIDGTLVDTNYHHAIAWYRAFRQHGIILPLWQIHRRIGMGGDQVVKALTDEKTDEKIGDDIRAAEKALYLAFIDEVEPMEGSRELIEALKERGHTVVLASSAKEDEVDHYLDLLDARDLADAWTTSADVESTKPEPDLVERALEARRRRTRARRPSWSATRPGTSWPPSAPASTTWPCAPAASAWMSCARPGRVAVYESVAELCAGLDDTPLA